MRTDEDTYDTRIAIQPESELEQRLLSELFARMKALDDSPPHPEYVGSSNVFYTLDLEMYDDLDHDLWEDSEVGVDAGGKIDPEPGSRALVVIHQEESYSQPTEQEIDRAVESLVEGEDEDNEFTRDAVKVAVEIDKAHILEGGHVHDDGEIEWDEVDEADRERLWELASDASTTGIVDIPIEERSDEEIVDDLRDFVEIVEERLEDEIEEVRDED